MATLLLGVDPGREKTGLAVATLEGEPCLLQVAATAKLASELEKLATVYTPAEIVLGDGTNSAAVGSVLKEAFPAVGIVCVAEGHSTEEARVLYWQLNPPTGWRRLFPLGLLVPPETLDAYAALVLLRRYLGGK